MITYCPTTYSRALTSHTLYCSCSYYCHSWGVLIFSAHHQLPVSFITTSLFTFFLYLLFIANICISYICYFHMLASPTICVLIYVHFNLIMSASNPAPFPPHLLRSQNEHFFSPPRSHSLEEDVLRQIWNQILYGDWIVENSRSSYHCLKAISNDLRSRHITHLSSWDDFADKLRQWSWRTSVFTLIIHHTSSLCTSYTSPLLLLAVSPSLGVFPSSSTRRPSSSARSFLLCFPLVSHCWNKPPYPYLWRYSSRFLGCGRCY